MKKPKPADRRILIFDLETSPILGYTWKTWQTDVVQVVQDWQIICFSYKWHGEKKVHFVRPDKKDPWNDKEMVEQLWSLFNEAEIVVAHNLNRFDYKKSNAMFLRHGLTPPSPVKRVDTLAIARSNFANSSNRLDSLGEMLEIGKKVKHEGFMKLFEGCMQENDEKWWRKMKKYNDQDVILLEKLYVKLLPWIKNHPVSLKDSSGCPKCSSKILTARGYKYLLSGKYQQYRCNDCGAWFRGTERIEKIEKPKFKQL